MDIEYHYYITCIIARRAGFSDEDSYKIAYSCQHTDDNNLQYQVRSSGGGAYENYISQTLNILKPRRELLRIHPCFHFFPGILDEIVNDSLPRKDGKLHLFNTTPNNSNARALMDGALNSENLYRVGIATHTFADTFAHQNFVGFEDSFNSMKGILEGLTPNIGHADAKYAPDWPALLWTDGRIVTGKGEIDNKRRFLEASEQIFTLYRLHLDPAYSTVKLGRDRNRLVEDLDKAIGARDRRNAKKKTRIKRYLGLMGDVPDYKKRSWFNAAVRKTYKDVVRGDYTYEWKQDDYENTDWFKFQEAVKEQQEAALTILKPLFERTELVSTSIW